MSDAMTNREIEDVLTSIRRLVAQEGRGGTETGRLILTEAQRIMGGSDAGREQAPPVASAAPEAGDDAEPDSTAAPAEDEAAYPGPLELTDPVMTDDDEAGADDHGLPAPDFGQLEATIAELEAAVSAGGAPSGPEATTQSGAPVAAPDALTPEAEGEPSNVTALYGRLSFQHRRVTPEAEAADTTAGEADVSADSVAPVLDASQPEARPAIPPVAAQVDVAPAASGIDAAEAASEAPEDDDGEEVIDEAMLRALVAQIVRDELHGQLGERITQQVRKLVRTEIAKALDDRTYL